MKLRNKFVPAWQKGFTLIELLVVIGIIGILAAVVLVAINPARQFASARDTERRSHLYSITSAAYQYAAENDGNLPPNIPTWVGTDECTIPDPATNTPCALGTSNQDLSGDLVPTYIPEIPVDPSSGTASNTGYDLFINVDTRLVASASSELNAGDVITVVR